jgi:hypothetical protein
MVEGVRQANNKHQAGGKQGLLELYREIKILSRIRGSVANNNGFRIARLDLFALL